MPSVPCSTGRVAKPSGHWSPGPPPISVTPLPWASVVVVTLCLLAPGPRRRARGYRTPVRHGLAWGRGADAHGGAGGGLEPLEATVEEFAAALRSEGHTLKRALTDPTLFSGVGNAYSDEVLHRARLSPIKLTRQVTDAEVARLHAATRETLLEWT